MDINWFDAPADTEMGRAMAFDANAPSPLPVAGDTLVVLPAGIIREATDLRVNDFVVPGVNSLYTAFFEGSQGTVSYNAYTQLLVSEYDLATDRLTVVNYYTDQTLQLLAGEFSADNYLAATALPTLLRLNGRRVR